MDTLTEYTVPLLELLNEMTPYLLLGLFIAGILHEFVPRRIYANRLSGNNFSSVLWAALFGIPLPLCSCGVIPTAASLRREGASKGATVSFLVSTPQTGVDSILATASLLGIPFAIMRPLAALVTALAGGYAVNRLDKDDNWSSTDCKEKRAKKSFWKKCAGVLHYGFIEMLQDVGKWIVIGLIIAAIITVAVPDNLFSLLNGYPLLNMLVILLISIPMYLCATGSIPIAAALMLKGLSPGAAFVLLMAGPATNMAAIFVINKILGKKSLVIYLASIIAGAIFFGLAIDNLLPQEWFTGDIHVHGAGCCAAHGTPWWQTVSSIIFAGLLITAMILRFKGDGHNHEHVEAEKERRFGIKGMMCNHCKANVEKAIAEINGVTAVKAELPEGAVYVQGKGYSPDEIISAIRRMGYEYVPDENEK